jgi:hypothetical protein
MPVVRPVKTVHDVISAFAEVDVMHSHLAKACGYAEGAGFDPSDDYFHGIFSMAPQSKRKHILVFTGYKTRMAHDNAVKAMGPFGAHLRCIDWHDKNAIKFRAYKWAGGDDISVAMEERAMTMICEKLQLAKPADWRTTREAIVKAHAVHAISVLPAEDVPKPPSGPLLKCACGNFAKPNDTLCNACTLMRTGAAPSAAGGGAV